MIILRQRKQLLIKILVKIITKQPFLEIVISIEFVNDVLPVWVFGFSSGSRMKEFIFIQCPGFIEKHEFLIALVVV